MKDEAEKTKFLDSNLRAMNLWFAANDLRSMKQEEWKLNSAGIKLNYFRDLEFQFKKTFRFNLFDRNDEVQWEKPLEDFMNTMISYDEIYELIYDYIQKHETETV